MSAEIPLVTLLVHDYDEAIRFYIDAVGFELREDSDHGDGKRWVVVGPRDEAYGRVAVFEDLSGNRWELIEDRARDR